MSRALAITGLQPTGLLHLGNYLGVLSQLSELSKSHDLAVFVADLHALTTHSVDVDLRRNSLRMVATCVACGVDYERSVLFIQSDIPYSAELCWLLSCVAPYGHLSRMTQFKDKARKQVGDINLGLFAYPVLMAADILLYKARCVPIGEDQKQHLEFTRDLAMNFNKKYGAVLTVPEPLILSSSARIMSLTDGSNKMSKSDISDWSRINLDDEDDVIIKKVRRAKSDSYESLSADLADRPEVRNLLNIFSALSGWSVDRVASEYGSSGFANFKHALADLIVSVVSPIRLRVRALLDDEAELMKIADSGKIKANSIAEANMREIKKAIGM